MDEKQPNYLAYWRKRKAISLSRLSEQLEAKGQHYASPKTLNRWEKGETRLPAWATADIAKLFRIPEEELINGPREADATMPVNLSGAYTGLDLEVAEHVVTMAYTSWLASHPADARRAMQSVMPWLDAAQRRAPRSPNKKQGLHLLARGHELLGALALDCLQTDEAISRFRQALTISEEVRDHNLIAAHMTQLGDAYRRKGDHERALGLMGKALEKTQRGEHAIRGYVLEMLAYTTADAGDEQAFIRHIEEATDLLSHTGEGRGAEKRDFIPFEVYEIHGKALRDLGHADQALPYLEAAEKALMSRPSMPRWHAMLTISRAQALCDAGELKEGVRLAIHSLTMAHACNSPRQMNRIRKLMRALDASEHATEPAVAPLREVVREIYMGERSPLSWQPKHSM